MLFRSAYWSWVEICISYFYFSSFLNPENWKKLENINVQWLIRTAWNYHYYSGAESSSSLVNVLNALKLKHGVTEELDNITRLTEEAKSWVEEVINGLS